MKRVKFDGYEWILLTEQGFFNPNSQVYFYRSDRGKIAKLMNKLVPDWKADVVYEIPDNGIYTAVCGPKCGPLWPDRNCNSCGGNGVGATFDESGLQMGGTDLANQEVENIKNGCSNIHPELNKL